VNMPRQDAGGNLQGVGQPNGPGGCPTRACGRASPGARLEAAEVHFVPPGSRLVPQHESTALENLTHSLVGATLAELTLPTGATRTQRRIFFVTGVAAANLPDADLLYTRIVPPPLGYLLHHRGHTHTLIGLIPQALLIAGVFLLPSLHRHIGPLRARLLALIGLGLLSHLVLDSWNSYGVHPFWPVDSRWYYGDAIYILEPWLWVILGVSATLNTQTPRGRVALGVALAALAAALAWFGMITLTALAVLAAIALTLAWISHRWAPRRRAGVAVALTAVFVVAMFGVREQVRATAIGTVAVASRPNVVDVILSPQPANPLCWTALTVLEDPAKNEYVMTRGTVTAMRSSGCGSSRGESVAWDEPVRQSLSRLRELARTDCSVRAWLQFGRAPEVGGQAIGDLRYGGAARENFSRMLLSDAPRGTDCPSHLTHWGLPRADLLAPNVDRPTIDATHAPGR
jgi:inner membrane protein